MSDDLQDFAHIVKEIQGLDQEYIDELFNNRLGSEMKIARDIISDDNINVYVDMIENIEDELNIDDDLYRSLVYDDCKVEKFRDDKHINEKLGSVGIMKDVNGVDIQCSICLESITSGTIVRVLPECKHIFHPKCINTWIKINANCPTCRKKIL